MRVRDSFVFLIIYISNIIALIQDWSGSVRTQSGNFAIGAHHYFFSVIEETEFINASLVKIKKITGMSPPSRCL